MTCLELEEGLPVAHGTKGREAMYRLAVAAFLVSTPALAQNAKALRDCTPIKTTASGEAVYGLDCKALKPENRSPEYKPNMPQTELKDTVIRSRAARKTQIGRERPARIDESEPSSSEPFSIRRKGYTIADQIQTITGKRVKPRRHDAGSGANETADGLDATNEALRHAAEDIPSSDAPDDVENVPVFDRADLPPKI
jgi:hypothetical protein